jgi:2-dehydro-3-deoxyphosphogluconate aldolase/(4S)-4-hydroxy-2-oxoglutarate aldolase
MASTATAAARLTDTFAAHPVLAILRSSTAEHFVAAAEVIADAGVLAVEFTLTTPGALTALRELRGRRPDLLAGAGTVLSPEDARQAVEAGAQFLVAPCTRPDTLAAAATLGVPMIPGAFTPTEVATALDHGAEVVKLFPASLGPSYLRALRAPLPNARLLPTGGVDIETVADFLAAGAFAVGLGSPLTADTLETGDLQTLAQRARRAVTAGSR